MTVKKITLKEVEKNEILSKNEMRSLTGGDYTCWCNGINIGSGSTREECDLKCSDCDWCG